MAEAIVLDSSALFAVLCKEPGSSAVVQALMDTDRDLFVSSVNVCEVVTKLALGGGGSADIRTSLRPFLKNVVEFDAQQALYAGELARVTKRLGLSLGDRACLALAASRGATAWTTDAAWLKLKLDLKVHLLRG